MVANERRRANINEAALLRQPRFITIRGNGCCVKKIIKKAADRYWSAAFSSKPLLAMLILQ